MAMAMEMGWMDWASAWAHITSQTLLQRALTRHLPPRIALPSSPSIAGLTFIITGSTSGIGLETARQLAEAGANVVLACRNIAMAQRLIHEWEAVLSRQLSVEVMELNLLSLSSVKTFAAAWEARQAPLHVLINNAGIFSMSAPQRFSEDRYEEHMQVNHLAPALLTMLLLPSLYRGAPSRVINVNSDMQCFGIVDPNDLHFTTGSRKYSNFSAYSGSKAAQLFFSSFLQNKLPNDSTGIYIICVNPGIVKTNVVRTLPKFVQAAYRLLAFFSLSPLEGARSVLYCATDPQVLKYANSLREKGWPLCAYYSSDCKPMATVRKAKDVRYMAPRVWEKTLEAIGLKNELVEKIIDGTNKMTM